MRERLTTLACALGALLLIGSLLLRGDTVAARRASPPTTLEPSDNGLLGASTWLQGEGVRTLALRERFGALLQQARLPRSGNLLIVSLPAVTGFRSDEALAIDRWIRGGNTLLVLAALRDRPGWARYPFIMTNDLQLLTELSVAPAPEQRERSTPQRPPSPSAADRRERRSRPPPAAPRRTESGAERLARLATELSSPELSTLVPNRAHPYFSGVTRAEALSDYAPLGYRVTVPRDGFVLSLAHEQGSAEDAFWVRPHGEGTIIVSGFGSLFSNRALGRADNARLLANLVAASVGADGVVVFDDEHQGLSDTYDPARFYRDRRLYGTLAVIAAVWLSWVLGATRLHAPIVRSVAPRQAELVRTTGLYLARVLRPAAAARRLLEQFLQRVGTTMGAGGADPARLWEWLENHPRLPRAQVQQLREWYAAAGANRNVPLIRLHNLILSTERQLAQ
ncbi:MAG TPA: DUF4350 domain-containing protein [Steroidobacteraceae bacterium]|jgi:hypothetical protein|nr:DUF4350 domain-containing protein [Steroidobacteraceae bacterium]